MTAAAAISPSLCVVVAGGGTGGHLFPGIALAEQFVARNPETRVLFIGTGRPFEAAAVHRAGFTHRTVTAEGIKRRGWRRALSAMVKIPKGIAEAVGILSEFRPHLVLGVGGYASGPTVAAGWLTRKAVVLQEQNLIPGAANRVLSVLADRIYVSFPETADRFSSKKVRVCGNPVRREVIAAAGERRRRPEDPMTVLVLGGSQGAQSINTAVIEAVTRLKRPDRIFLIHQTGETDAERARAAVAAVGIGADVRPFFHDVGSVLSRADLVICRAGATTVAELTAIGKAVIFIPFPYAADDHQTQNAGSLARRGAAEMIAETELSGEGLARKIDDFIERPEALAELARRARQFGRPEAAEAIVDDCLALLEEKGVWTGEEKTDDRGQMTEDR